VHRGLVREEVPVRRRRPVHRLSAGSFLREDSRLCVGGCPDASPVSVGRTPLVGLHCVPTNGMFSLIDSAGCRAPDACGVSLPTQFRTLVPCLHGGLLLWWHLGSLSSEPGLTGRRSPR
jgi:hypothetical protein